VRISIKKKSFLFDGANYIQTWGNLFGAALEQMGRGGLNRLRDLWNEQGGNLKCLRHFSAILTWWMNGMIAYAMGRRTAFESRIESSLGERQRFF
jgi:hypothetical protein